MNVKDIMSMLSRPLSTVRFTKAYNVLNLWEAAVTLKKKTKIIGKSSPEVFRWKYHRGICLEYPIDANKTSS